MPRQRGSRNKLTEEKLKILRTAAEIVNDGRSTPIDVLVESYRVIRELALVPMRRRFDDIEGANEQGTPQERALLRLTDEERKALINGIYKAAAVANWAAEYVYPKYTRVDAQHFHHGTVNIEHRAADNDEQVARKLALLAEREREEAGAGKLN